MNERELLERFRTTREGQGLLRALRFAEGTEGRGVSPYQVMFGGGTFKDLSRHPDKVVKTPGYSSAAAGAYQFLPGTWQRQAERLGLKSFGPVEQDIAALALARNRLIPLGGLAALQQQGFTPQIANALAPEWASIPTLSGRSYYGQPSKPLNKLQEVYAQTPAAAPQGAPVAASTAQQTPIRLPRQDFKSVMQNILNKFGAAVPGFSGSSSIDKSSDYLTLALQLQDSDSPGAEDLAQEYLSKALMSSAEGPDPIETVLETVRGIQDVQTYNKGVSELESKLNANIAPSAAQPTNAPVGAGGFIARTGSTGISTGPHIDIRWADRRPLTPKDVDKYLRIGGRMPSQLTLTSGWGKRSSPAPGASSEHAGIDLAIPVGTPVYATGGARLARSLGNISGGGYTVEVNTPEGLLQLLHLQERSSPLSKRV